MIFAYLVLAVPKGQSTVSILGATGMAFSIFTHWCTTVEFVTTYERTTCFEACLSKNEYMVVFFGTIVEVTV